MAVLQPAITGDVVQDSWAAQVTRALNSGTLGGGATTGATGSGGSQGAAGVNGFNTATIYLFRRTTSETPPDTIAVSTTYTYETGVLADDDNGNTGDPSADPADDITGWYRAIPSDDDGGFVWTIQVSVADQGGSDTIAASTWSAVTLLSRPGDDAVNVLINAYEEVMNPVWSSLSGVTQTSPNFKNDTAKTIGLAVLLYEAGDEVADSVYTSATYVWSKNGDPDFMEMETQIPGDTGKTERVLLINEMDVAEGNINEVFTCQITY